MKISTLLDSIDNGTLALPEFQRGYVWNREQVRVLMDSLYRRHPVGSLLVWVTQAAGAPTRGLAAKEGVVELLLDGQQRITSLYGIMRGAAPRFFEGNAQAFTGLHFNLESEVFEFYAPLKMRDNPLWIDVTKLMREGLGAYLSANPQAVKFINRLNMIDQIREIDFHVDKITGKDVDIDTVVDIFNRVNSGGTKLSTGDLALAKVCASWPEARGRLREIIARWDRAGYHFDLDWLLRSVNAIVTGEARFAALAKYEPVDDIKAGVEKARDACSHLLDQVAGRLGLDHDRVLAGRYAFPVMARLVVGWGGKISDGRIRDKLLFWYVHSFMWGRFAASAESTLKQDFAVLEPFDGGALDRLIDQLRLSRGDLRVRPEDFGGWSLGARFYPLLYLLTRVLGARDWGTGIPLRQGMFGRLSSLQQHHIFPKKRLYEAKHRKQEVNAIANFCFLTQGTNLEIGARYPEDYFPEIEARHPGALASQWIPTDPRLWKLENYREFLKARRELLAKAANDFLDELLHGRLPEPQVGGSVLDRDGKAIDEDDLGQLNAWLASEGLAQGKSNFEVTDGRGDPIVVDMAWPDGLQAGLGSPVALLLDEDASMITDLNRAGYTCFSDLSKLRRYVEEKVLVASEA